jgi:adenine-specific DNA-methyltransferase
MDKIKNYGQVFTPDNIVDLMFKLSKNSGKILEPSAGEGAFTDYIIKNSSRSITSIEIDKEKKTESIQIMDFFDFDEINKYSTIIGNPPYVSYKNIHLDTIEKIQNKDYLKSFDNRSNLYLFFIRKCIEHMDFGGEMIFITPREFIKATSSISLNNFIYEKGTITDWYEYGDISIFKGFSPTVAIWRFEKDNFTGITSTNDGIKEFKVAEGQIFFTKTENNVKFSDLFFVKVGAVSGMDKIFINENGNTDFVCSSTKRDGKLRKMFYNIKHESLYKYKDILIKRKIKKFDESNWWRWGRGMYESEKERIYVNCKTRDLKPFFTHDGKYYDGSVLAIFPKKNIDIDKAINFLNNVDWNELGFKVGGRLCFTQKSLENTYLPDMFLKLIG